MNRRSLLATVAVVAGTGLAGCLDSYGFVDDPRSPSETDSADYPTGEYDGQTVPLAPLEDVYEWFEAGETRFVDTRGRVAYEESHVEGAVLSPGPDGLAEDDPTDDWDRDERVVTYCACPHTLAVQRGSTLLSAGFERVYAIDEGFNAWTDAGYPVEGENPDAEAESYDIEGRADPEHAGNYVYIRDDNGGTLEVAQIGDDGHYETTLRTSTVTGESILEIEAPGYTVEASLDVVTSEPITEETGEGADDEG